CRRAARSSCLGGAAPSVSAAEGARLVPGGAAARVTTMGTDIKAQVPAWIRSLAPYPPGKPIEELEREYGIFGSIKLASNENPLGPSPKAVAAITAALADLHRYPDGNCFYLKQAVAKKYGLSPDAVIFGNG